MRIPYDDPIDKSDIESELEYATEGWKTFFRYYYQLVHQNAPPSLVDEVVTINNIYKDLTERIAKIAPCFPERK